MASLNLSTNGPSIKSSYQAIVNSPPSSSSSATYAHWAVFSVQAPLLNAFQDNSTKESVLKVQTTGDGEFSDLLEEFSEGRIQFAFVKVKDPNSGLPKNVLIAWCGEGVPERTKGYFTSHLAAVSKVLHGYHVQLTARSESDLDPDLVFEKVSNASGAKYSAGTTSTIPAGSRPPPPLASKPAFTPTKFSNAQSSNPIVAARNRSNNDDGDGWGANAPQVTRTELQKVDSAYKPTKVNMSELTKQTEQKPSSTVSSEPRRDETPSDVVRGGYQPIGKVDIAALRSQAKNSEDFRPAPVKGAYEPVGKVDIAAIRAKAQPQSQSSHQTDTRADKPPDASYQASSTPQERLTSMPKPKVANKFGSSFGGTKPPVPTALGFAGSSAPAPAPVGAASRTFADQGGKTPAQLWAEKKAQQTGTPVGDIPNIPAAKSPVSVEKSGSGWKSGYTGKSWSVQAPTYQKTVSENTTEEEPDDNQSSGATESSSGGVSALKDRFKSSQPIAPSTRTPAPPSSFSQEEPAHEAPKAPASGFALPGLPSRPKEEEEEDEREEYEQEYRREPSPIRVAIPVARTEEPKLEAPEERHIPPPIPTQEIEQHLPRERELADDDEINDVSRGASHMVADHVTSADQASHIAAPSDNSSAGGKRALVQYDYEKAEDNEIELVTGAYVTDIDMVDEDWWLGTNSQGDRGLFPSNYVELLEEESVGQAHQVQAQVQAPPFPPAQTPEPIQQQSFEAQKPTATANFDYEAAEDNELSFPEGAKITNVEFPDEDWWFGQYGQKAGLFPSNYVQLDA